MMDKRNIIQRLFGFCPCCGRWFRKVITYRQDTAYVDDAMNFFTGCYECKECNDDYWQDMWEQVYGRR